MLGLAQYTVDFQFINGRASIQSKLNIESLYQPTRKHKKVCGFRSGFRYILAPGAFRTMDVAEGVVTWAIET